MNYHVTGRIIHLEYVKGKDSILVVVKDQYECEQELEVPIVMAADFKLGQQMEFSLKTELMDDIEKLLR